MKKIKGSSVVQFIKASLRLLTWLLMIVPLGLLGSAWVIKGLGTVTGGILNKMNKGLKESLELEVADDEEAEANEDEEELDETGCKAKKRGKKSKLREGEEEKEDVDEAACCVVDDPASHLLDKVGVKASTANLVGNDAAAISIVEKLLSKIDKLESKIDQLEGRAEKNSVDATPSKSVNEPATKLMHASEFVGVVRNFLQSGEVSGDSPVKVRAEAYGNYGLGGVTKVGRMFNLWFDTNSKFDGLQMNVSTMLDCIEGRDVVYNDEIQCMGSNDGKDTGFYWRVTQVEAKNDVLVVNACLPKFDKRKLECESSEDEPEKFNISKDEIEDSKMKFLSGLDKLNKSQLKKVFDEFADRVLTSFENQKRVNPDPSVRHTNQEVRDAVKKINFFRRLSYAQELTDEQKREFADLVYKYWYDWIYVEKKDEDGETYLDPVMSVSDMLNQPFKSGFARPGDKVPLATEFKIWDNGNVYTLQPFNYTLDVDDYKQRKSIAKRKQRLDAQAKRDAADAGKGFVPKRGTAGTWSINDWNRMIGSLSDNRRREIKDEIMADIEDELKNDPQERAREVALVQSLFNGTARVVDANKSRVSKIDKDQKKKRKQLKALRDKMQKEVDDLDKQVGELQKVARDAKKKLDADPDNEDLDVDYDNAKFDLD